MTRLLQRIRSTAVSQWQWFVPIAVLLFIYRTHGRFLDRAIAGLLGLTVVLVASRRPDRSLLILIVGLPFQGLVLAQLYAWGMPRSLVRPLSSWKEALALGVVVAGVEGYRAGTRRLDRLDRIALAYVAIVSVYALVPRLFATDAPTAGNTRSLAFRQVAGFVILFLAARHARLPSNFATRAANVIMIVGAIVSLVGVYEYFFSDAWNSFIVDNVKYIRYQLDILHAVPWSLTDVRRYATIGGQHIPRVGSTFFDPLIFGFFLIVPLAVAIERRLRRGVHTFGSLAVILLISAALVTTLSRAALVAALVVVCLAVRHVEGRAVNRRIQFASIFVAALIVALPAISATGLSERISTATSGQDQSSIDHVDAFWRGVHAVEAHPLGRGVGTSAGVGQRFDVGQRTITENNYLQVGIETGVIAMLVFIALTVSLLGRLRRAGRRADLGTAAICSAAFGLAVGAFFLHTWTDLAVSWPVWALAGTAIGIDDRRLRLRESTGSKTSGDVAPALPG